VNYTKREVRVAEIATKALFFAQSTQKKGGIILPSFHPKSAQKIVKKIFAENVANLP
jgi:hypothetical protein